MRMKAYGNHFWVEDQQSATLQTNDSIVASVFHISSTKTDSTTLNYVGVLNDILKLNYGPLLTPIIGAKGWNHVAIGGILFM